MSRKQLEPMSEEVEELCDIMARQPDNPIERDTFIIRVLPAEGQAIRKLSKFAGLSINTWCRFAFHEAIKNGKKS